MEESFTIKANTDRLESIVGLKVIMDFNHYTVLKDGEKVSLVRYNDDKWGQIEGNLSDDEVEQIGDAIESKYM